MKIRVVNMIKLLTMMIVAAMFAFALAPVELRWTEADVWFVRVVSVVCVLSVALFFVGGREVPKLGLTDALVFVWTAYFYLNAWIGGDRPCDTSLLQACVTLVAYCALRLLLTRNSVVAPWFLVACVVFCGLYEAVTGLEQMVCGTSRHHLYAMTGTFLNPGPYSAFLMVGAVTGLAALRYSEWPMKGGNKRWKTFSLSQMSRAKLAWAIPWRKNATKRAILSYTMFAASLFLLAVLPATCSRAAMIGVGVCFLWLYREKYWKYRFVVWGVVIVLLVAFYFFKQGSADGRLAIWAASLTSWLHSPWTGLGIGGFCNACAEGMAEMWHDNPALSLFESAGVTDYAYNELLKILVEQGVVGALLCVVLCATVMWRLYRQSRALFAGLLSLLIFSMFSYPFEMLSYRIVVVVIAAWSASSSLSETGRCESLPERKRLLKRGVCMVVVGLSLFAMGWSVSKEISRRMTAEREVFLFSGLRNEVFIKDYYILLPYVVESPQFLFNFAMTLRESGRYRDSNAILRLGTRVSTDPMFYVLMGNNYKDEQHYDLAEKEYLKAFAVLPNRLYPLFRLMLMYEEMGDKEKCSAMAKRVVRMKPKVESPATNDMKKKAYSFLKETKQHEKNCDIFK
ncbi:MAG: O-antigen ligase family protein [Prevotellaceae bacterium]|nr:O-antigen ligase family protein [Prevotellaceae bacterium]